MDESRGEIAGLDPALVAALTAWIAYRDRPLAAGEIRLTNMSRFIFVDGYLAGMNS